VTGNLDQQRYLTELAQAMDERKARIGEHAAEHSPTWAIQAIGPVPDEPLARLDWEQRASHIGAYRELYSWNHDTDPVGPEPSGDTPDKRTAWHAAFTAMNRTDTDRICALPDGSLWQMRATYQAETQWAPPHVGAELRQVRIAAQDQAIAAVRADAEAAAARKQGQHERAARHELLARSARAAEQFYRQREQIDAALVEDSEEWARITAGPRHLAITADSELRRRHPGQHIEPLRSAEPEPTQDELPPVPSGCAATAKWVTRTAEQRAAFREKADVRRGLMVPSEDPDYEPEGEAWPTRLITDREAILQPPKPDMRPTPRVTERSADWEASA
jgi:hypothetical protein